MGPLVWLITFFILLCLTVPIGVSIGMSIIVYFLLFNTQPISFLCQNMFTACDSFPLMAIPFFVAGGAGGCLHRSHLRRLRYGNCDLLCILRRNLRFRTGNRSCNRRLDGTGDDRKRL